MTTRATKATGATKTASKASADKRRANAMSKSANAKAAKPETVPTSFRIPKDLAEALEKFTYSERNTRHLKKSAVVLEAIRQYIGYEG